MGGYFETIPESTIEWLLSQKVFWVATAPLSATGHVNISPKGGNYFGLANNAKQFWYLDLTGSGSETVSHLYENGRITVQFNAFEGPPRIMRLYGYGEVLEYGSVSFKSFVAKHNIETIPGSRCIIIVDIHQVGFSCGYSVPRYDFKNFRTILNDQFRKKEEKFLSGDKKEDIRRYWAEKNSWSVDGLPGALNAMKTSKAENIAPEVKMKGPHAPTKYQRPVEGYSVQCLLLVAVLSMFVSTLMSIYGPQIRFLVQKGEVEGFPQRNLSSTAL